MSTESRVLPAAGRRPSKSTPRGAGPKRRSLRRSDVWWGFILIAPTAIGLGVFSIWPAFQTFYFTFTKWGSFGGHTWTGLTNYFRVFEDPEFGQTLINTFIFAGMTMLSIPLGIVVAALLNRRGLRGVSVYRVLYFLPFVTLPAAVALVWKLLYSGDYGPINWFLGLFGIDGPSWVSDPHTAIYAVGIVSIWSSIGFNMVLFLAGLQSIPQDFYEAASIDGATRIRQFFSVTLPLLSPTIFFVAVITVINALQAFDLIYLMVGKNNPALPASQTVVYMFYQKGIIERQGGYAAAIAFILLAIIVVLTLIQFRVQKKWVHYE